jgi:hypothetical protein
MLLGLREQSPGAVNKLALNKSHSIKIKSGDFYIWPTQHDKHHFFQTFFSTEIWSNNEIIQEMYSFVTVVFGIPNLSSFSGEWFWNFQDKKVS